MILGVDIGGTKIAVAGFEDTSGGARRVTDVATVATPADAGGEHILTAVTDLVEQVRAGSAITAVGVGTAGVVGADGRISSATDAIRDWAGFPVRKELEARVHAPVRVLNDVHAAAVAEAAVGAGAAASAMLMVTVGTGIGGAVVLSGEVYRGGTGTAGSLGHIEVAAPAHLAARRCSCGVPGHVEAVASGPALERTYLEITGKQATLRQIHHLALAGDTAAAEVILEGARLLGGALAGANALVDVEIIVVGGGVAQIGPWYLDEVTRAYRRAAMPGPSGARIVPATLGVDATLTGAALFAGR